jgi:hypothetical protein
MKRAPLAWWTNAMRMIAWFCIFCSETSREYRERDHLTGLDQFSIDDLGRHRVAAELASATNLQPMARLK